MGCGTCVAAPAKNCFHRCQALLLFALEGLSLWHVGWNARYNINSCNFSWILQKCISLFFFFPFSAQPTVIWRNFMCVCVFGGWVIYTVKFLVFVRSEKNGKCTPRKPEKQKANKRNIMLTWKLKGSWKKKLFWFRSFPVHVFFVSLQLTIMVLSNVKLSDTGLFQLFFLQSDEKQFPVNEQQSTAESSLLSRGFKTWAR